MSYVSIYQNGKNNNISKAADYKRFSPWDIWMGNNAYLSHYLAYIYCNFMDERFKYYYKYNENIWKLMSRLNRFKL